MSNNLVHMGINLFAKNGVILNTKTGAFHGLKGKEIPAKLDALKLAQLVLNANEAAMLMPKLHLVESDTTQVLGIPR